MSKHRAEHLSTQGLDMAQSAIVMAAVTGSVGSTHREQVVPVNGSVEGNFVTVERVAVGHAAAWRIADASVDPLTGAVLVMSGNSGRYSTHSKEV